MWRSKKEQDGAELCQAQAQLDYAWLNSKFMNSNFFKHRGMSSSSGPPIKLFNTSIIVNKPARLTTIMNGFFINKVIQLRGRIPAADSDPVERLRELLQDMHCKFSLKPVSPEEVSKIVAGLKNTNSNGMDFIDTWVVKLIQSEILPAITHIISPC